MSNGRSLDKQNAVARHALDSVMMLPAQAVLEDIRPEAASVGLAIRPSRQYLLERNTEGSSTETEVVQGQSSASKSPYTSTRTFYLRTRMGRSGVLQIHEACACLLNMPIFSYLLWLQVAQEQNIEGYTLCCRVEEVWPLLGRNQLYCNWFTKLSLGSLRC